MTPGWESSAAVLERRYQWLLAWYPPRHRRAHGEEMLGVLLAAAGDGQRRPRLAEAANLLWGALLIWIRPQPATEVTSGWSDALALFSVAAPLALAMARVVVLTVGQAGTPARFGLAAAPTVIAYSGLGLALPFAVLGLRRTGGVICAIAALLLALLAGNAIYGNLSGGGLGGWVIAVCFFSYATEAWALLASPGPRRGWRLLSWPGWVLLLAAAAAAGILESAVDVLRRLHGSYYYRLPHPPTAGWLAAAVAAGVVLAVIVAGVAGRSAPGRRLLALFAITACPWLVTAVWTGPNDDPVASMLITYLPPLILSGVVLARVRQDRRAGAGHAASA